ncbi:BatD family protein [Thermodesulfobacteriota bacterium]
MLPSTAGADVSVSMTLDRSEATTADSVRLVVSISGSRESKSRPVIRNIDKFHVTSGGTSSRVEIINGKMNAGIDYTYYIQPKQSGTFRIGPAEVKIKGKTYKSDTKTLVVVKTARTSGKDRGALFLEATLSSDNVYEEEQAIYILKLYRRANVRDISLNLPEMKHITMTQLGKVMEYQSVYNGKPYQVLEVRYALISSEEGDYSIGPAKMNMTALQSSGRSPGGPFNDPFFSFSRGRPVTITGEILDFKVRPLPEKGRPPDFRGMVGRFELVSKLEPPTVKAGESATFTVSVNGRGRANLIPDMKMPALEQTKVYADQPVLNATKDREGLKGGKIMKWAIVPEKEGRLEIPLMSLSYFDTKSHEYRTLKTAVHYLSVLPGQEEGAQAVKRMGGEQVSPDNAKHAVKELGRDILPIHTSIKDLASAHSFRPEGLLSWTALLLPVLLYFITFITVKRRKLSAEDRLESKAKRAVKEFKKQCKQAELSSNELILAVRDYLNNRMGLSLGSLTADEASEILESRAVSHGLIEEMRGLLKRCEDNIYTGKGNECSAFNHDIIRLIKRIDRQIQ